MGGRGGGRGRYILEKGRLGWYFGNATGDDGGRRLTGAGQLFGVESVEAWRPRRGFGLFRSGGNGHGIHGSPVGRFGWGGTEGRLRVPLRPGRYILHRCRRLDDVLTGRSRWFGRLAPLGLRGWLRLGRGCMNLVSLRLGRSLIVSITSSSSSIRGSDSSIVTGLSKDAQLGYLVRHGFNRLRRKPLQHLERNRAKGSYRKRSVVLGHRLLRDADMRRRQGPRPRGSVITLGFIRLAVLPLLIQRRRAGSCRRGHRRLGSNAHAWFPSGYPCLNITRSASAMLRWRRPSGKDEAIDRRRNLSRRAQVRTQAAFRVVLTGKVHGQRSRARRVVSADRRLASQTLAACEAGSRRAVRRSAAGSQLVDVSITHTQDR